MATFKITIQMNHINMLELTGCPAIGGKKRNQGKVREFSLMENIRGKSGKAAKYSVIFLFYF